MQAAILLALQAMPLVEKLIAFITDVMTRAKAAGELTPEQEAAYQAHQANVMSAAAWKVEPDPDQPPATTGT